VKYIFITLLIFSNVLLAVEDSSIDKVKSILKDIKPYYNNLMLPQNLESVHKKDILLYKDILEKFLKDYLQNPTNYRIKFLLGYYYYNDKNYKKSIYYFEDILGVYSELNDYILFYLGDSYQVLKKNERAYQAYSLIDSNSLFYNRALIRKLNILFDLKRFSNIKVLFNNNRELLDNNKLNMIYVNTLIKLKEYKNAILQLKKMWFRSSGKKLKTIESILKTYVKKYKIARISSLEYYNRCEYLLQKNKYSEIKRSFKFSYTLKNKLKINTDICLMKAYLFTSDIKSNLEVYLARINKLKIKRDKLFKYNVEFLKLNLLYVKKDFISANTKARFIFKNYHKYPNNEEVFRILIASYGELKDNFNYYRQIDLYLENSDYMKYRVKYLNELWRYFYFEKKDYKKVIKYLEIYLKLKNNDLRYEARAKYYRAKSYLKLKDLKKSTYYFIKMIIEDPFSYYSYAALNHLKKDNKKLSQEVILSAISSVKKSAVKIDLDYFYNSTKIIRIFELLTLGLDKLAKTEILNFRKIAKNETEYFSIALFLENLTFYKSSRYVKFRNLRMMPFFPSKKSFLSFWKGFYPKKFRKYVEKYSKKFNVEPAFSWAIIREESAYNPRALSSSNAYGLMQLLYPTAVETANRIGVTLVNPELLFEPKNNIPLGVKYLSVLLVMFKRNKFYAAASYNGGATNVKKWIKAYNYHEDIYDWSEEIPFEETNRYIYKVLSSYHTYRLLYERNYFKIGKIDIFKEVFK